MLYKGKGGETDFQEARKWFEAAADGGNPDAMYYMAKIHSRGKGVPENDEIAKEWYKRGAEAGQAGCEERLAMEYAWKHDKENFEKWMVRSAQHGYWEAAKRLCEMNVPHSVWMEHDPLDAYRWCAIAYGRGVKEVGERLNSRKKELTPEMIAQQDKLAAQFLISMKNEQPFDPRIYVK